MALKIDRKFDCKSHISFKWGIDRSCRLLFSVANVAVDSEPTDVDALAFLHLGAGFLSQ